MKRSDEIKGIQEKMPFIPIASMGNDACDYHKVIAPACRTAVCPRKM
jgi:hypothetical protein